MVLRNQVEFISKELEDVNREIKQENNTVENSCIVDNGDGSYYDPYNSTKYNSNGSRNMYINGGTLSK